MATLVQKYFSKNDLDAIEKAVADAESTTSGELAVQLASFSKNWMLERVLAAIAISLGCMLIALYVSREHNWGYYYNFTQGALWGLIGFLAAYFGLKPLLESRARRRKVVWGRALDLFSKLTPTRGHTGVLIFVSLEEEHAAVVADKGIASKVPPEYWDAPQAMIMQGIRTGNHCEGIIEAVKQIGTQLATHFPREADDINEFPDRPTILDK